MNLLTKLRANCPQKGDKRALIPRKEKAFSEKTQKNRPRAGTIFPGGSPKGQRGDFSPVFAVKVQKSSGFSAETTEKGAPKTGRLQSACKPGSVVGSHLSWADIAARLCATCLEIGRASRSPQVGVASDRVYRMSRSPGTPVGSYPTFPPFPRKPG